MIMADFAYNSSSSDEPEENLSQPLDDGVPPSADSPHFHVEETLNVMLSGGPLNVQKDGSISTAMEDDANLPETTAARAYQLEMLDRSLKQNVIVSMETGSGKTRVAIMRIMAELEKSSPDKLVWFIAPTVLLCGQQFDAIKLHIPAVSIKLLTGPDRVHEWTKAIWGAVLPGTRIIVSTPQVLYDALAHAFVKMEQMALLVFDEAHNCVKKNAGSKLMLEFYHQLAKESRPSILGLSASPSMSSRESDIDKLEKTLDSICVSPTMHREDLLKWVNKPKVQAVQYQPLEGICTKMMASLRIVYYDMKITEDPYIIKLAAENTDRSRRELEAAVMKHDSDSQNQVKGLHMRSLEIARELGTWAADFYIHKAITDYVAQVESSKTFFDKFLDEERRYLAHTLRKVSLTAPTASPLEAHHISHKADLLIRELLSAGETPVAIVFAKERATVSMLYELLTVNSNIRQKYRLGAVVGTSNYQGKKRAIYDFISNVDLFILQKFRSGQINLLIATSVLEEGIDVPACNLVICFDQPATLKSFVQRRGRARERDSKLVLFFSQSVDLSKQWEAMEEEMKRLYQDEERDRQLLETIESSAEHSWTSFVVPSTGARLDFDNAKQHLEHFCRKLSPGEFVDARPDYIIGRELQGRGAVLTATVLLPTYVPSNVRTANSKYQWKSEKNATKDAAFHAYVALYHADLVNEHLLPFEREQIPGVEARAAIEQVESVFTPWQQVAQAWISETDRFVYTFTCYKGEGVPTSQYEVILPLEVHEPRSVQIFLDDGIVWELRSGSGRRVTMQEADDMQDHTSALLAHHFGHRWPVIDKAHVVKIAVKGSHIMFDGVGSQAFEDAAQQAKDQKVLIRDKKGTPFLFQKLLPCKPPKDHVQHPFYEYDEAPEDTPYVVLKKWTRRADFLHPLLPGLAQANSLKPYGFVLPLSLVTVDAVPVEHVEFAMLIPSLLHELEVMLVARHLVNTLLVPIGITDIELVRAAISSKSAAEPSHYERLEFLGDSILKYCATILSASLHLNWPEGYLSFFKDRLVSNARLSRAAIETGLAKYILYDRFTGKQWRPLYLDVLAEVSNEARRERALSTKVLADVVEALIGAAYCDGGIEKALSCIGLFVHEQEWSDMSRQRQALYDDNNNISRRSSVLEPLEELIGYTFQKQSLLVEAMTHASFVTTNGGSRSLERLEFIGDAILDKIIVTRLFAAEPPLTHDHMHTLKTALVNGDFLAFLSLEYSLLKQEPSVTENLTLESKEVRTPIWKFMRHASTAVGLEQAAIEENHKKLRGQILEEIERGMYYPWALLARLQARKFFSDLIEALLGAVWIDSGSLTACQAILERLGVFAYLDRILRDRVQAQHPKELVGKYAVNKKVKYEMDVIEKEDGEREFFCTLHIGDRPVTRVAEGLSREEVQVKAAAEAVRILDAERRAMRID